MQIVKNLVFLVKVIKRLPESKPQETTAADATDATADEGNIYHMLPAHIRLHVLI